MTGASIQDVEGLSPLNAQLLKQRDVVGDPVHALRAASKKVVSMVSVVSKFKEPFIQREMDDYLDSQQ
jgi:hypothetical protein